MANRPDSSLVEGAILALLLHDAELQTLCPDGVWWDAAGNETATRFVVISQQSQEDVPVFGGRACEDYLYLVKAVMLNAASLDIRAAAHRVDQLLDDPPPDSIVIPGYVTSAVFRERRVRYVENDAENASIRWLHWGGQYRVQVSLAESARVRAA
jgi:hypothetical protein